MFDYGCPKKRKDGMPKKHDPKKREKERKRGVTMCQKKRRRERDDTRERTNALRSKPYLYPSIHSYTCTFWPRLHDLFLDESSLWLYNIWNASMPCSYPTLSSTKTLYRVGKTEGRYCPSEDNKSWVLRENHFGELGRVFENFQNNLQIDCRPTSK